MKEYRLPCMSRKGIKQFTCSCADCEHFVISNIS